MSKPFIPPVGDDYEYTPELHEHRMEAMREIMDEGLRVYEEKNPMYGDSFVKCLLDSGLVSAKTRLNDKNQRFKQLVDHPERVLEGKTSNIESIEDTLMDNALYSLMTLAFIRESRARTSGR